MLDQVPVDLQSRDRWLLWQYRHNGVRWTKVPLHYATGQPCNGSDGNSWCSFNHARGICYSNSSLVNGIGVALGDGLSCFDLDKCLNADRQLDNTQIQNIVNELNSYTEISPGKTPDDKGLGYGLHTFVKDNIDKSRAFEGIEVYGEGRYMTVTGNVFQGRSQLISNPKIVQDLLQSIDAMRPAEGASFLDWNAPETQDDNFVCTAAYQAANGQKFYDLYYHNGFETNAKYGYPSDSEAEMALLDILAFYTDSPLQVRRIFMNTTLGQRPKLIGRDAIVNRAVARAFDRKLPVGIMPRFELPIAAPEPEVETELEQDVPDDGEVVAPCFSRPYGLLGEIYDYAMRSAYKPMEEVAIAVALGTMAAICGRQFQCQGAGLNLYLMVLATTGAGKDQMSKAFYALISQCVKDLREEQANKSSVQGGVELNALLTAKEFVGPAKSTAKGILLEMMSSSSKSFGCVWGEFSETLSNMAHDRGDSHEKELRHLMLAMYTMSQAGHLWAGSKTAAKERDVPVIESPALTIMTESTPSLMYEAMSDRMISSGFLPRFSIFHRTKRTTYNPLSPQEMTAPPKQENLIVELKEIIRQVYRFKTEGKDVRWEVQFTAEAYNMMYRFRNEVDRRQHATQDETIKELWNRAVLKANKMAALYAIGYTRTQPVIQDFMYQWARDIVIHEISELVRRFKSGDVGANDGRNDNKTFNQLMTVCKNYFDKTADQMSRMSMYRSYVDNRKASVIPYAFIRAAMMPKLDKGPNGANTLRSVMKLAIDGAHLVLTSIEAEDRTKITLPGGQLQYKWNKH